MMDKQIEIKRGGMVDLLNQEMNELQEGLKQKQIEEMAEEKNSKQWQIRDKYCLRIQKATQYKGDCDYEDVPSILVDYEKEIKKELIPEGAVVLTREEYDELCCSMGVSRQEVDRVIDMVENDTRKETAEKFAERLKDYLCDKSILEFGSDDSYIITASLDECYGKIDEICKEFTEGKV